MSWRVISISSNAKLDYKMNYLVVRTAESTKRISLTEIAVLIIESTAVSLTAYLLSELQKCKINVIICDEKRLPQSMMVPLSGSFDSPLKIRNQISWKQNTKEKVWSEIVKTKIHGQLSVLISEKLNSRESLLKEYIDNVEDFDKTNREGHAAKVYFNDLFGNGFSRSDNSIINSALNYGYSIILSAVAREIAVCGYTIQLGIFHNNVHNNLNLACDFMEVFRPFVDIKVKRMKLEKFEHEEKVVLIQILNSQIYIDGQHQYMIQAVRTFVRSVFDALQEDDISKIKRPKYEL